MTFPQKKKKKEVVVFVHFSKETTF